ncbi:DUF5110 domain-containing protein, partial [Acinetobacter baumannii]
QRTPLTLIVAAGSGASSIYQDRGEGYAYKRGEFRRTLVHAEEDATRLRITLASDGSYRGRDFSALEIVGLSAPPREVRVDGQNT